MILPSGAISLRPERAAVLTLLESAGLPTADLAEGILEHFFSMGPRPQPYGVVGLEIHDNVALLRSLAVSPQNRSAGAGSRLVSHAEDYARSLGVEVVYLLTTTAEPFFAKRGYRRIERSEAPESIRSTREFSEICPVSSAFMAKHMPIARQSG